MYIYKNELQQIYEKFCVCSSFRPKQSWVVLNMNSLDGKVALFPASGLPQGGNAVDKVALICGVHAFPSYWYFDICI